MAAKRHLRDPFRFLRAAWRFACRITRSNASRPSSRLGGGRSTAGAGSSCSRPFAHGPETTGWDKT